MGLDRIRKTPCGFCFVEYFTRAAADNSVRFLSGSKLDERVIRVDYDVGFEPGRQFGRGRSGGQVRDEYRMDYDPGRGGYGKVAQTGMNGMQLWNEGSGGRNMRQGPAPDRNMRMRGGRGRGRGRGRGYRPRGPRGQYNRYYDGPANRPMKRQRDDEVPEDGARMEQNGEQRDQKMPRVDDGAPNSAQPPEGKPGEKGDGPRQDDADDGEQTRNARFERGKQNEFDDEE